MSLGCYSGGSADQTWREILESELVHHLTPPAPSLIFNYNLTQILWKHRLGNKEWYRCKAFMYSKQRRNMNQAISVCDPPCTSGLEMQVGSPSRVLCIKELELLSTGVGNIGHTGQSYPGDHP